jgi:hypothetical protein
MIDPFDTAAETVREALEDERRRIGWPQTWLPLSALYDMRRLHAVTKAERDELEQADEWQEVLRLTARAETAEARVKEADEFLKRLAGWDMLVAALRAILKEQGEPK